jgi:phosphate transport system substrate-binding protein
MKQMPFSWPFWSFWVSAIVILLAVCLVMVLWVYPYVERRLSARKDILPGMTGIGTLALSGIIVLVFYLWLPEGYACQALTPSGVVSCPHQTMTIAIGGSTALNPLIHDALAKYAQQCSNAHIENLNEVTGPPQIQGSLIGLEKLSQGRAGGGVDIGTSDVFISSYTNFDAKDYQDYQVGVVKYVVIVNKPAQKNANMPINLSTDNLQQIYLNGDASNQTWGAYGGPQNEKIIPFARNDQDSGTEVTFRQYVIHTTQVAVDDSHKKPDPQTIITSVENTPGGIGYVSSYDWARYGDTSKAQVVDINGYSDDNANIKSNFYPFWNIEHLYTKKGNTNQLVKAFIDFLGSKDMVSDLNNLDYMQLPQVGQNILATRCPG